MSFLKNEVQSDEMIRLARKGMGTSQTNQMKSFADTQTATIEDLVNTGVSSGDKTIAVCLFCKKNHATYKCFVAKKMTLEEKKRIVYKEHACFICLRKGHTARQCEAKIKCTLCHGNHYNFMCEDNQKQVLNENKREVMTTNTLSNCGNHKAIVYLQTIILKLVNKKKQLKVRAIIDTASQGSYVAQRAIDKLKLMPKTKQTIVHGLFGGKQTEPKEHHVFDLKLVSLDGKHNSTIKALSQVKLCGHVPKIEDQRILQELKHKGIVVNDLNYNEYEIDLLSGADSLNLIFTGNMIKLNSGLIAMETKFGYSVSGKINAALIYPENNLCNVISLHCAHFTLSDLWELDIMGIKDPYENKKRLVANKDTFEEYKSKVTILSDGRFQLHLPFKDERRPHCTKDEIVNRHNRMCKRVLGAGYLEEYIKVFQEWERLNMIERVPEEDINNEAYYLPHRPVIRQSSQTTKIRPVFDASYKEKKSLSLNDCLMTGPNLIELIPDIIDRFRSYSIGISADIEKAFLQLSITPEHRDFVRFIWPSATENLIFRHCRVVFGVSSSPFLLAASINYLIGNAPAQFNDVSSKLMQSFYVDNCVTGVQNISEQERFINTAAGIMSQGCFNLRGWISNVPSRYVDCSKGETNVLGIVWDLDKDILKCSLNLLTGEIISKRNILALVQRIFDPIGMLSPTTLQPKLLLQETWVLKLRWDDPLPSELKKKFLKWEKEILFLEKVEIPRYMHVQENSHLNVFVDACKFSYACCVFIRTETSQGTKVHLIRAKSRVAPLKSLSIPRLELVACCIGARLVQYIKVALDMPNLKVTAWCDSMVALWWIKNAGDWSIFVTNRVREINGLIPSDAWRHIPGHMNPADFVSRGCSPLQLLSSCWWEGPLWLREPPECWPTDQLTYQFQDVDLERRKVKLCNLSIETKDEVPWYAVTFSNFQSIIRLIAWILRFIGNLKLKPDLRIRGPLTFSEIMGAEQALIRIVQGQYLAPVNLIPILNAYKDEHDIIRVKTKLSERIDTLDFISPIILPGKCLFTQRLIENYHIQYHHAGTQILLGILRENYWIIGGRKVVRKIVRSCMRCQRYKARNLTSFPVSLPAKRVNDTAVFEVVGIDLAGPLYVKGGVKVWIVLYTCAVYRAVHLELATSLSTESFLLSLRRFISRRGRPSVIYSDNATNFKGAQRILSNINWTSVLKKANSLRIDWKFNPPSAAWWGGWWERLIRIVKELLRRTLGKAVLSFEELQTIICDCEFIVNSRPLTYLSEKSEDFVPISPLMFLLENKSTGVPELDSYDAKSLQRRIKYRYKLLKDLRSRFRNEYLGLLMQTKESADTLYELKLGEIVLMGDDNKKRVNWPLAKIIKLLPGRDGKVRTVKLQTQSGIMTRPIQRVFPSEVRLKENSEGQKITESLPILCKSLFNLEIDPSASNRSGNCSVICKMIQEKIIPKHEVFFSPGSVSL